jgi:AcrR family transcriptional regulator
VFARKGYAGTKIQDIVREAGLSTGAIYGRFGSKNDLLREAVVRRTTRAVRLGDTSARRN